MTQEDYRHPITPPPELSDEQVGEWLIDDGYPWDPSEQAVITITTNRLKNVARQAYQAGADQELEACCEWLVSEGWFKYEHEAVEDLRAARRPKPTSLKEQALAELEKVDMLWDTTEFSQETLHSLDTIRCALEQLPDNE
jgi:hypothetical protein